LEKVSYEIGQNCFKNENNNGGRIKMVFGRKKKKEDEVPVPMPTETEVLETNVSKEKEALIEAKAPELPSDLKEAIEECKSKYIGMFSPAEFRSPETIQLDISFGIFAEMKKIRECLERMELKE